MSGKKIKNDENHYKKLYRKLKKDVIETDNQYLKQLDLFQNILTILVKRAKDNKIVITLQDVRELKKTDRMTRTINKNKDIVFELEK